VVVRVSDTVTQRDRRWFADFVVSQAPRLRQVLVARYGADVGSEAFADSLVWAWDHRERFVGMANPLGYLFRVGQNAARRRRPWTHRVLLIDVDRSVPAVDAIAQSATYVP
jgi:DNA-directed RNA polymerase specialized sigma24 family protein